MTLKVDGGEVAKGEIEKTIPIQMSLGEGLDIGMDVGSAVDFTYQLPFAFSGSIESVIIALR